MERSRLVYRIKVVDEAMRVASSGKEKRVYRWYATPWEILRQKQVSPRRPQTLEIAKGAIPAIDSNCATPPSIQQERTKC